MPHENPSKAVALTAVSPMNANNTALLGFLIFAAYIMFTTSGYAALIGSSPMGNVMCAIVNMILGNLGRGLACCAIAIVGIGAMLGKVSWGLAATVGIGIAVTFGCVTLASTLVTAAYVGEPTFTVCL